MNKFKINAWTLMVYFFLPLFLMATSNIFGNPASESTTGQVVLTNTDAKAGVTVFIDKHRNLFVQEKNGKSRLLMKPGKHESFFDPKLSPNGEWVQFESIYPYDGKNVHVSEFTILINIQNGQIIDEREPEKIAKILVNGSETDRVDIGEWVQEKDSTLSARLYHYSSSGEMTDQKIQIDLTKLKIN